MTLVREGGQADLDAVYELNREAFPEAWSRDGLAAAVNDEGYQLLITEVEGGEGRSFAGYLLCHDVLNETHIMQVAVKPEFRRQGIAHELTMALCAMKSEEKITAVLLEVRASNRPARKLYASLGFREVGFRPRYYVPQPGQTEREDAILMTLKLIEPPHFTIAQ